MKKIDLIRSIAVKSNLKKEQIAIVVDTYNYHNCNYELFL